MAKEKRYYKVPYNGLPKTKRGKLLFFVLLFGYIGTWLPYFGFMNQLVWIGPITQPMAWTLALNAINTVAVLLLFKWIYADVVYEKKKEAK